MKLHIFTIKKRNIITIPEINNCIYLNLFFPLATIAIVLLFQFTASKLLLVAILIYNDAN